MLATIYNYEPNLEEYDYHQQWLIKGIYGFESFMTMTLNLKDDLRFIDRYCREHNLDFPRTLEQLRFVMY